MNPITITLTVTPEELYHLIAALEYVRDDDIDRDRHSLPGDPEWADEIAACENILTQLPTDLAKEPPEKP